MINFIEEKKSYLNVRMENGHFDARIIGKEYVTITKLKMEDAKKLYEFLKKTFEEA